MQAPDDLLCPITHAVFRSPVVTSVGTVYEEHAILQHLESSSMDPLTNQRIEDERLIPVYLLRSRAKQYAVDTARACIDVVLSTDCEDPAKYLRRACDLCDEAGAQLTVYWFHSDLQCEPLTSGVYCSCGQSCTLFRCVHGM